MLFAAPRVVALQGDLPFVRVDEEGSVQSRRHDFERIMYKALSDTNEPRMDQLRNDLRPLPVPYYRYLQLPDRLDPRIGPLATRSSCTQMRIIVTRRESDRVVSSARIRLFVRHEGERTGSGC